MRPRVMSSTRDLIGPALPPHFARAAPEADPDSDVSQGPALPPDYKSNPERCGCDQEPTSPHEPREMDSDSEDDQDLNPKSRKRKRYREDYDDGFFGPALPPGFKKQDESPERFHTYFMVPSKGPSRPIIGPALPPGFKKQSEDVEESTRSSVSSQFTTQREATDSSDEEEIVIGPMPPKGPVESSISAEIERRSRRMKEKLLGQDDDGSKPIKRESWMTELPPELKGFGLGPRTFKRKADDKSEDRSIWTDTPADREKKAKEMQDAKPSISKGDTEILLSERDKRLAEQVSSYNECQRSESLMDIHHKKLKSKATQEKNKPQERRPFDRDQDLHVHQFDEAQKKALLKKARDLNTRFSHSKCNMFL